MRLESPAVSMTWSSQILSYSVRGLAIRVSSAGFGANRGIGGYLCRTRPGRKGAEQPISPTDDADRPIAYRRGPHSRAPMRASKVIHVVSCHAEGEVGDVIVGGVPAPPGDTLWEQSRFVARDGGLRNFVLNEPRGGVFRHVNLLVPAKDPRAQMGWIIMEPADTPPMSGSNSICVATVLLDAGIIAQVEPVTRFSLEAPGGLVDITAECRNGK